MTMKHDKQLRVVGKDIDLRAVCVVTTALCEEARQKHGTIGVATEALAQALTGALLTGAVTVKGWNKVGLQFRGEGPLGEIYADANGQGHARGYVGNPAAELPRVDGSWDLKAALGTGFLSVTTDLDLAERYHGVVSLLPGEMAPNLVHYFDTSAQIPTYVGLTVELNEDGSVAMAGGFLVQNIPGTNAGSLRDVEGNILGLPRLSRLLREEGGMQKLMEGVFRGYRHDVLGEDDVAYVCPCSRARVERTLIALGQDELEDMLVQDMGAEIKCEFCAETYSLNADDLLELLRQVSEKA